MEAYGQHLETILSRLPAGARELIQSHSLHDAHLQDLDVDMAARQITLSLQVFPVFGAGDRMPLQLAYTGVQGLVLHGYNDSPLGGPGGLGDLGYDEWHLTTDGLAEHRLLFSSGAEIFIRCHGLSIIASAVQAGA